MRDIQHSSSLEVTYPKVTFTHIHEWMCTLMHFAALFLTAPEGNSSDVHQEDNGYMNYHVFMQWTAVLQ